MNIQPAQFIRDCRARSRPAASWVDRAKLVAAQAASTLRYRAPAIAPRGLLCARIALERQAWTVPVRLESDDWLAFVQLFVEPEYDWPVSTPATILDAGANCGYATLLYSDRYPGARIAAIEPDPANARAFHETTERNGIDARLFEAALAPADGEATLFQTRLSTSHSLRPGAAEQTGIRVRTVSMGTVLAELGWAGVDLLKLDIEGGELELFASGCQWLDRVRTVVGETHGPESRALVRSALASAGFDVRFKPARPRLFCAERP